MYRSNLAIVYGFYATDKEIAKELVNCLKNFFHSQNDYDWLGEGVCFWENNLKKSINFFYCISVEKC